MNRLNVDGFDIKENWFSESAIKEVSQEIDLHLKKYNDLQLEKYNQEVSTSLLAKDKRQTRELYLDKRHKEAFFIKNDNFYSIVNLMDPQNYIKSIFNIISNRNLNLYIKSIDERYKFKNSILFFKNKQDNNIIDWHRDSAKNETKKLIVGVYFESSLGGVDAVKYIPGSHLLDEVIIDEKESIEVPAKAGDCVIHFGATFHMSPEYNQDKIRRTLYLKYNLT